MPRFWRFKQLCARHSYVCHHGLYVVYFVMQTPSFGGHVSWTNRTRLGRCKN